MDFDDDTNPFADSTIRQTSPPSVSNQQKNDYNPFANPTTPAQPAPTPAVQPPSPAPVFLPLPEPPVYQPPVYTPVPAQQPAATRLDLSDFEKRQAELEAREKRIAEREQATTTQELVKERVNNYPPLPSICPCRPCFYHDIGVDIPAEFQRWVRILYYLWLFYSLVLFLNMIVALSYFLVDSGGAATFGLSLVYLVFFIPASYVCWFRPIYRAFKTDSSVYFMVFFVINIMFIITTILFAIGVIAGMCGFILMIQLFAAGGSKIIVGLLVMIVTVCFAILALADGLLLIKVHRLYRQSGASFEQAQKEFQTSFVNNSTVQGAAREVAVAGINQTLRSDGNQ